MAPRRAAGENAALRERGRERGEVRLGEALRRDLPDVERRAAFEIAQESRGALFAGERVVHAHAPPHATLHLLAREIALIEAGVATAKAVLLAHDRAHRP